MLTSHVQTELSKEIISKAKKLLRPYGKGREIAKETGLRRAMLSEIKNGKRNMMRADHAATLTDYINAQP